MIKSEQIARQLQSEIHEGCHGLVGERFLTVRAVAKRFSISSVTAQKVITHLRQEGVLVGEGRSPSSIAPDAVRPGITKHTPKKFRRFGLVLPEVANPFFGRLGRFVQQAAERLDAQVLMASAESDFEHEREAVRGLLNAGAEGLLLCPGLDEACGAFYRELKESGLPIVFVSRRPEGVEADFVIAHNLIGAAAVAEHLLSLDYTTVGYIAFGSRLPRDARLAGFRDELRERGIDLPGTWIADANGRNIESGYQAMERLMSRSNRPRAVFAYNDLLAIGALQYCHDHGMDVPGEVAVAGFDNLPESRVTAPPLTTVAYPVETIAQLAVQCLVDRAEATEPYPVRRILLEPRLIVRGSTDPEANTYRQHFATEPRAASAQIDVSTKV